MYFATCLKITWIEIFLCLWETTRWYLQVLHMNICRRFSLAKQYYVSKLLQSVIVEEEVCKYMSDIIKVPAKCELCTRNHFLLGEVYNAAENYWMSNIYSNHLYNWWPQYVWKFCRNGTFWCPWWSWSMQKYILLEKW